MNLFLRMSGGLASLSKKSNQCAIVVRFSWFGCLVVFVKVLDLEREKNSRELSESFQFQILADLGVVT